MKAGRELDALIAEKVMGWWFYGPLGEYGVPGGKSDKNPEMVPNYSTSIAAASLVAEKLRPNCDIYIEYHRSDYVICRIVDYSRKPEHLGNEPWAKAETAPLAICLAVKEWIERG